MNPEVEMTSTERSVFENQPTKALKMWREIHDQGQISRADLIARYGVKQGTVSNYLDPLVLAGVLAFDKGRYELGNVSLDEYAPHVGKHPSVATIFPSRLKINVSGIPRKIVRTTFSLGGFCDVVTFDCRRMFIEDEHNPMEWTPSEFREALDVSGHPKWSHPTKIDMVFTHRELGECLKRSVIGKLITVECAQFKHLYLRQIL